eukprot:3381383-Pyramimonas_sp.AAC.1
MRECDWQAGAAAWRQQRERRWTRRRGRQTLRGSTHSAEGLNAQARGAPGRALADVGHDCV